MRLEGEELEEHRRKQKEKEKEEARLKAEKLQRWVCVWGGGVHACVRTHTDLNILHWYGIYTLSAIFPCTTELKALFDPSRLYKYSPDSSN